MRAALGKRPAKVKRQQAAGQLAFAAAPVAPAQVVEAPATISLRADGLQLARFEALLERVSKLRVVPAGTDRLDDKIPAALDSLVASADAGGFTSAPTVQVIVQQCPDCAAATAVTSRGEKRLTPGQTAALACDTRVKRPNRPNRAVISPSVRMTVLARDRYRCATPGCGATHFLEVHHVVPRARGGSNKAGIW